MQLIIIVVNRELDYELIKDLRLSILLEMYSKIQEQNEENMKLLNK